MTLEEVMDKLDEELPHRHGWRYESRKMPSGMFRARVWHINARDKEFSATSMIDRRWALYGALHKARQTKVTLNVFA